LRNADPKNASLTSQVAGAVRDLALASERMLDVAGARTAYAESAALFADAMQASPDNIGIIENAARGLQLQAAFLDDQGERAAALRTLDRAAEIGDALVLQRGADADGVLLGVTVLNARARLRNLQGETKVAAVDLERAEYLLGQLGRPAAPGDLERAVGAVVDVARQWGFAGQLDRSAIVVRDALDLYALPQGASPAALVIHRIAMTKLLLQKSTVELDRGDVAAALATAAEAIRAYETDIVPHTRSDRVLDEFVQQLVLLGRTAAVGRDPVRARDAYCAVQPKVAALVPGFTERPRVLLSVLDSEFLCLQSRFFGGDRDESERLMADLAKRIDNAVPVSGGLMAAWRSLRARVAQLRTGMRIIAGDGGAAIVLAREAVRYHEDAVRVPSPDAGDLAGLAFMQGQLADLLNGSGDAGGARQAAEAGVAAWKKSSAVDRLDFKLEVKYAEAMIDAGALWEKTDDEKARDLFVRAANTLALLAPRVPAAGRAMVAEQRLRALQNLGDTLYTLDRLDDAIARHTDALAVAADLAAMRPDADANVNLARQHSRLARAFEKSKRYPDARDQGAKARVLFTANRDTSDDPAAVDRMLRWLDTLGKAIDDSEAKAQAVASEAR
jgi:tetratricopeptide (TPR) repeat protein